VFATIAAVLAAGFSGAESLAQDDVARREASPAQNMAVIGPFVDDLTLLVVRVDPRRLDLRPTFDRLIELFPDSEKTSREAEKEASEKVREVLKRTRGNAIYVVVSWTALPPLTPKPSALLSSAPPRDRSEDDQQQPPLPVIHRTGGVSIIVPDERGRVPTEGRASHPTPRPQLSAAWGAVKEYPVQLLLAPPPHAARTIRETLPELPQLLGGGSSRVLTEGLRWAAVGIDPQSVSARLVIQSDSPEAAAALGARFPAVLRLLCGLTEEETPIPKPLLNRLIQAVTPAVDGSRLVLEVDREGDAAGVFATAASILVENLYGAAADGRTLNRMKQIGLALHTFEDGHQHFPPPKDDRDDEGRPRLSWRVHLLPYLDEAPLYHQFHFDEPWDSAHNKKLIEKMPAAYRAVRSKAKRGYTTFLAPVGEDTVFGGTKPARFSDIEDGTSNTVFLVNVKDELAVPWTAPDDYRFDPERPGEGLQLDEKGQFLAVLLDGSVHVISLERNEDVLLHLFQKSDGQPVDIR
jgi:hypothetical protein